MKKTEKLYAWSACEIEGSIDSFIAMLKQFRDNAEKREYTNLTVELETKWECGIQHTVFVVKGQKNVVDKKKSKKKKEEGILFTRIYT